MSNLVYEKFKKIKEEVLAGCEKQEKLMQKLGVQMDQQSEMFKIKKQFELDTLEIQQIAKQKFRV